MLHCFSCLLVVHLCRHLAPVNQFNHNTGIISLQGEEFDSAVLLTAQALCDLKSAHAISGVMAWCEQVSGQKFSWMNGTIMKAKGW